MNTTILTRTTFECYLMGKIQKEFPKCFIAINSCGDMSLNWDDWCYVIPSSLIDIWWGDAENCYETYGKEELWQIPLDYALQDEYAIIKDQWYNVLKGKEQ